jgi:CSLREA domain-containing protein
MPSAPFARVLFTAACLLLALPALASAAQIVNTVADEPDEVPGGECKTATNKCSLRAAIQVTNLAGVADNILFDATVFQGTTADAIALGEPLPAITAPVTINAGTCLTQAGMNGPCAGITGPLNETAVSVTGAGVSILDIAFADAGKAIDVSGDEFTAGGNWLGLELDGTEGIDDPDFGIALEPGAEEAQIGGATDVARNVFANTTVGLRLRGAQDSAVEGNYFGVGPNGTTPALNTRNLVVADPAIGVPATGNTVGAEVGATGAGTAACDLGCNVFVSSSVTSEFSIDLHGLVAFEEKPATGPTTILGNYVGLDATGQPATEAAPSGIRVGSANEVTIGGADPGDGNQMHGGNVAVFAGKDGVPAKKLTVLGNMIGRARDNSGPLFPPNDGVSISSAGVTVQADTSKVEGNYISAEGSGVDSHSTGALIKANHIYEANRGVWAHGDTEGSGIGNTIEGNTIADAMLVGVYIQNDLNVVIGNHISDSGTGIGIENFLSLDSTENLIGGDGDDEGNVIVGSDFSAIEIIDVEGSQNEVGRNQGSGNGGRFIRLRAANSGTEPIGPNGGIKPPVVSTASKTEASGTAAADATVRVFSKTSTAVGELGAYLGKVTADSGGKWKLTYLSPVAGGALVAATQTNAAGGTSEVSATASVPPDPPSGCPAVPSACPASSSPPPGPTADKTPPKVTIKKAPKAKSANTTAKFKFTSNEAGSTFKCKLDKKPFKKCKSPKTYKGLKPGKHVFKVKATDAAGNVSAMAKRGFTVLE